MDHGPCRPNGQRLAHAAKSLQRRHLKVIEQRLARRSQLKAVRWQRRDVRPRMLDPRHRILGPYLLSPAPPSLTIRQQAFPGLQPRHLLRHLAGVQLGSSELARGDVCVRQPSPSFVDDDRCQIVGPFLVQQRRFDHGAGRDDARYRPGHQSPAGHLPHLLGDGHTISLLDQARDVPVHSMMGHARHRHALVLGYRARGQN
jgi:hypothetical protein